MMDKIGRRAACPAGRRRPLQRIEGVSPWICPSESRIDCKIMITATPAPISSPYARMKGAASFRPSPTLFDAVRVMKSLSTRLSRNRLGDCPLWQRSYHEHVIRNEDDYRQIWEYIEDNPAKWVEERYYQETPHSGADENV